LIPVLTVSSFLSAGRFPVHSSGLNGFIMRAPASENSASSITGYN
jgi:hypothetical protein